jgi:hypothetical protein
MEAAGEEIFTLEKGVFEVGNLKNSFRDTVEKLPNGLKNGSDSKKMRFILNVVSVIASVAARCNRSKTPGSGGPITWRA